MICTGRWKMIALSVITLSIVATPSFAQSDAGRVADLEAKMLALAEQLNELRAELDQVKKTGEVATAEEIQTLRAEVAATSQVAAEASQAGNEWKNTTSVMHIAGYGSAGFNKRQSGADSFVANFNPIFHFQYADKVLWESELETEIGEDGETEMGLEYSTIDFFLNDNITLVAGKFISPLGNFRQNIHPSWINKLPSAPPGYGHGGAAPRSDVGVQLRGGVNFGNRRKVTYAGYVGVGPRIEGVDGEIHDVDTGGFLQGPDGQQVFGGRVSILPLPKLEIGLSGATGDVGVVQNNGIDVVDDPLRKYTVLGFDAFYRWNKIDFRGEYISQDIADSAQSVAAEGGKWETWYAQGSYKFAQTKWEGVLRYTDFTTPEADEAQQQWAFGLNYLVTPNAIVQLGYEHNNGLDGEITDDDLWLFQIAYGY
jgi:hypothetical protein